MKQEELREAAALLKERADLMEFFSGDFHQIKVVLSFRDCASQEIKEREHLIYPDFFADYADEQTFWNVFRRRIDAIDGRLQQLGVNISTKKDIADETASASNEIPAKAGIQ